VQLLHEFKPLRKLIGIIVVTALLSSCSTLSYYWQAASGQVTLLNQREPIETVLKQPGTDAKLRQQLQLIIRAREFASQQLLLPDNESYRTYADLGRPYAVWNVIAAPALSIQPQQWCFLIVGCVNYRGYFAKNDAQALGEELQHEGMDVYVAGVAAYSTLGYFDDPVLNTMLRKDEAELVGLLFHELSHQLIYVKDDTAFNEAFATAVEQEGVKRWYATQKQPDQYLKYMEKLQSRHEFQLLLKATRDTLQGCYARPVSDAAKLECKRNAFVQLQTNFTNWRKRTGISQYDHWMAQPLNNAHLAIMSTYHELVPSFSALLQKTHGNLKTFYAEVQELTKIPKAQRLSQLKLNIGDAYAGKPGSSP